MKNIQDFIDDIQEFIDEIEDKYKSGNAPKRTDATEGSYRNALENLIRDVSDDKLLVLNEGKVNKKGLGKPDLVVKNGDILIGCAEAKDIDKDLSDPEYEEQFTRYKNGVENLIITNCLDWELYKDGELKQSVTIGTLSKKGIDIHKGNFERLLLLLQEFTAYKGLKITSSKNLAAIMANRAKGIKEIVLDILDEKSESPSLAKIESLHNNFKKYISMDLKKSEFADMFAQTVTYGLFVSRLGVSDSDSFSKDNALKGISKSIPFLRGLFKIFSDEDIDERLNWHIEKLIDLFKLVDRKLFSSSNEQDLFIHFYEDFLSKYDKKEKKTRGVYYTPVEVVKYIVNAVDDILRKEFDLGDGLADESSTVCYKSENGEKTVDKVQILDPAAGTGTFLVEIIRKMYEKYRGKENIWGAYVDEHLLDNLHGFEILMTPYVMCHLNIDTVLKETGYKFDRRRANKKKKGEKRYNICLTNTLDLEKIPNTDIYFLEEETKLSKEIKNYRPIKVIIGNPPYNSKSLNKGEVIKDLISVYKKGLGVENEKGQQPLSDDYIKFIRFAEHYIARNGNGVIGFITNNRFLDGVTHRQMRKHLLETFDNIYIINLHGKMNELPPWAPKDENVFDITIGVSINIFVKTSDSKDLAKVYYKDIYGLADKKYEWLSKTSLSETEFTELSPDIEVFPKEKFYFFAPKKFLMEYNNGFKLTELLPCGYGVKTHNDKERISYNEFEDNDEKYLYKPFDLRHVHYDLKELGRADNKIMQHFRKGENLGLCTCRMQELNVGYKHALVTTNLTDVHLIGGWTYVFPLYFYDPVLGTKTPSFKEKTLGAIEDKLGMKLNAEFTPEDLLDYIYGVLYSNKYRNKYGDFLKIDFPRIPYPEDKKYFFDVVSCGKKLRDIHLLVNRYDSASHDLEPYISSYIRIGYKGEGDGASVSNNVVSTSKEFPKFEDNRVYINKAQYFDNIPEDAWNFYIGDWQPLQEWLKRRKGHYELKSKDIWQYEKMVNAITETIRIMEEIDRVIRL